ncbi:hypothetical protein OROMI_027719 [Orobanche minor]
MEKKKELLTMMTSDEWNETKHAESVKGKGAVAIAHSASFWRGVSLCLKVFALLVKMLRIFDGYRKPTMGFVYGELLRPKEEIKKVYNNQDVNYRPILEIVKGKARYRLDSPLHLAAYLLNPYFSFDNPTIINDEVVMDGYVTCVEKIFLDDIPTQILVINVELHKFYKREGMFGKAIALEGFKQDNESYDPVAWWNVYENGVPNLQKMAKRILSLTTSSSSCERNWSSFEGMEATMAQGWIIEGGDDDDSDLTSESGDDCGIERRRSCRIQEIRELHEDDFVSDEEEDDGMDYEFESDTDEVLEEYGEVEFEI